MKIQDDTVKISAWVSCYGTHPWCWEWACARWYKAPPALAGTRDHVMSCSKLLHRPLSAAAQYIGWNNFPLVLLDSDVLHGALLNGGLSARHSWSYIQDTQFHKPSGSAEVSGLKASMMVMRSSISVGWWLYWFECCCIYVVFVLHCLLLDLGTAVSTAGGSLVRWNWRVGWTIWVLVLLDWQVCW